MLTRFAYLKNSCKHLHRFLLIEILKFLSLLYLLIYSYCYLPSYSRVTVIINNIYILKLKIKKIGNGRI